MKKIELLAPAGNMNGLYSAINAGADAVYIGGYAYSARGYAKNFSNEELVSAIEYAHRYGVKIYVTVNTLIYDDEVHTFMSYIDFLHKNNVDAIIIQDLGMLDLIRKTYPNLEIHASTQMHIHNIEGVKFAQKYGIKRVVLARETPIDTIREIKNKVDIDLEVFCHGALCVCYSGQCLMSSLIGGRSGNRGVCAGTCRLPYDLIDGNSRIINKNKFLLSMKDLNTVEYVGRLIKAGVTSLKIEGRMKREEYIYLVVSIYRKAIDSFYETGSVKITDSDLLNLKKIYNRMFTKGFLFNEENDNIVNQFRPNHQGIKIGDVLSQNKNYVQIKLTQNIKQGDGIRILNNVQDVGLQLNYIYKNNKLIKEAFKGDIISLKISDKVNIGDIVLKTTDILQIEEIKNHIDNNLRVKISGYLEAKKDGLLLLKLDDSKNLVEVKFENCVEKAKTNPITHNQIIKQIKKLGNTIYELEKLDLNVDDDIFISIKDLNELRRMAILKLDESRKYKIPYKKNEYHINIPNFKKSENINYFINSKTQYDKIKYGNISNIYIDNLELYESLKDDNRVVYKLPRVINNYKEYFGTLLVGEVGSLNYYDNNLITDFSFNVTNSYTVAFLHSIGVKKIVLSYELTLNQIETLINKYIERYNCYPNLEVIIYGYPELMVSKFKLLSMYQKTGDSFYLRDRYGELYNVREKDDLMYIYNNKKLDNLKQYKEYYKIGVNNLRINVLNDTELKNVCIFKM